MSRVNIVYATPTGEIVGSSTRAANVTRTWVYNEVGTASYTLPLDYDRLLDLSKLGTVQWIYQDGTPTWVGYVEARGWSETSGGVEVSLRSAEGLLKKQLTRQGLVFGADQPASAGLVAQEVFLNAVRVNGLSPLRPGIFDATRPHFGLYDYADAYDVFAELSKDNRGAFWIDSELQTHFRDRRGLDLSDTVVLQSGYHFIETAYRETLEYSLNAAVGIGSGNSIPDSPKAARITPAIGQHRAEVLKFSNATDPYVVERLTLEAINNRRRPRATIEGKVPRSSPFWGTFFVGDTIRINIPQLPYRVDSKCRVLGYELDAQLSARLVLETEPIPNDRPPSLWRLE